MENDLIDEVLASLPAQSTKLELQNTLLAQLKLSKAKAFKHEGIILYQAPLADYKNKNVKQQLSHINKMEVFHHPTFNLIKYYDRDKFVGYRLEKLDDIKKADSVKTVLFQETYSKDTCPVEHVYLDNASFGIDSEYCKIIQDANKLYEKIEFKTPDEMRSYSCGKAGGRMVKKWSAILKKRVLAKTKKLY